MGSGVEVVRPNRVCFILNGRIECVLDWWDHVWLRSPYRERFLLEATVSLPTLVDEPAPAAIYQAMLHQRTRLKADQQLAEWTFGR